MKLKFEVSRGGIPDGAKHSPSDSFLGPPSGPIGGSSTLRGGGTFDSSFSGSNKPFESEPDLTASSLYMRNPILLMFFRWDHGFNCDGTDFGRLLGSFLTTS